MTRSRRFEDFRYVGDKDTQRVFDSDADDPAVDAVIEAAVESNRATAFSPDTLAEARNRGYRPARRT